MRELGGPLKAYGVAMVWTLAFVCAFARERIERVVPSTPTCRCGTCEPRGKHVDTSQWEISILLLLSHWQTPLLMTSRLLIPPHKVSSTNEILVSQCYYPMIDRAFSM
jgi:hypothetical protein